MRENQLASLLITLFGTEGELERFIRSTFGRHYSALLDISSESTEEVYRLCDTLTSLGLVDEQFFDRLLDFSPNSQALIERVRQTYVKSGSGSSTRGADGLGADGLGTDEVRADDSENGIDASRAAWRKKLAQTLDETLDSQPQMPHEWINAAAVLATFDPVLLKPLVQSSPSNARSNVPQKQVPGGAADNHALLQLAPYCHTQLDGRWRLQLNERRRALAELWQARRFVEAINTNTQEQSLHTDYLMELGRGHWIDVRSITKFESLAVFNEIANWLRDAHVDLWDANLLSAMMERFRRIQPLRKLVDAHFSGREAELLRLREHVSAAAGEPHMLNLFGIGGVGKSALLGKRLLDMNETLKEHPWVYLDFDNPAFDPAQPRKLLEEIIKQLSLLYETREPDLGFVALESLTAGIRLPFFTLDTSPDDSTLNIMTELDRAIRRLLDVPKLLIVLDTFEQVQVRGQTVLVVLQQFIQQLMEALPYARLVISGRAEVQWPGMAALRLTDLDRVHADAMLKSYQIDTPAIRERILERVGCNPLSLKLVGSAISTGQLSMTEIDKLLDEAVEANVQGQLYTRILGHILDDQVRRLAHPGLVVRRVTPGVIADVLASVCGFDKSQAASLFQRLPNYVSLFESDGPTADEPKALRHRQDLRETMLRLMIEDRNWNDKLRSIHDLAINYYQTRTDPVDKAEELYHRLMRGDDATILDSLWNDHLKSSLARSWLEPLPDNSRTWLGIRLGLIQPELQSLRTIDWEVVAYREATEQLKAGLPADALVTLRRRQDRTPSSPLYTLEVEALSALNRTDEALALVRDAIVTAVDAGNIREEIHLQLLAASLEIESNEPQRALKHARRAARLSEDSLDQLGLATALMWITRYYLRLESTEQTTGQITEQTREEISKSVRQLEQATAAIDDEVLRYHPELVQKLIATVGNRSQLILQKLATAFDNRVHQTVLKKDAFQLESLLKLLKNSPEGQQKLEQLAVAFGLQANNFDTIELASYMVRYGRIGQAVAEVLDSHGDDLEVRHQATQMFNVQNEDRA